MSAELNSVLENKRYFCQVVGCVASKSSQTLKSVLKLKKTRPLVPIAAKLGTAVTKVFNWNMQKNFETAIR